MILCSAQLGTFFKSIPALFLLSRLRQTFYVFISERILLLIPAVQVHASTFQPWWCQTSNVERWCWPVVYTTVSMHVVSINVMSVDVLRTTDLCTWCLCRWYVPCMVSVQVGYVQVVYIIISYNVRRQEDTCLVDGCTVLYHIHSSPRVRPIFFTSDSWSRCLVLLWRSFYLHP